ncbi:hypothetical protein HHK36_028894 [Tetracentron sinense]|uniref:Stress-response A/B barrel domain-containing protein n=1 Tax=Tetracentron sinense TaxID=13715 RepID=A0A834YD95_TETSI|nr:hypothetical protein HHK36_028894 [Tetracentron sinense]
MCAMERKRDKRKEKKKLYATMPVYAHIFSRPSGIHLIPRFRENLIISSHSNSSSSSSRFIKSSAEKSFKVSKWNGEGIERPGRWNRWNVISERRNFAVSRWNRDPKECLWRKKSQRVAFSGSVGQNVGIGPESSEFMRKRKVVEHICLLKAKGDLSDEEEKDMLDYLYTSQYQMGGIVAISLGRISDQNLKSYTHAVYMRFQRKEDLAKFYENSFYLGVLKEHVMPYCHGLISVDYESEVEDDILLIFRKGEEFNYGVEFVLLISVFESALGGPVEDALESLGKLTMEFPSLIVQSTQGINFNLSSREYTHGVVIRFRSLEALEIFVGSSEYKDWVWSCRNESVGNPVYWVYPIVARFLRRYCSHGSSLLRIIVHYRTGWQLEILVAHLFFTGSCGCSGNLKAGWPVAGTQSWLISSTDHHTFTELIR